MLCKVCDDDTFDGDNLNCFKCNDFLHFGCAALRESAFRKMSKAAKQNCCCNKCKLCDPGLKTQAAQSHFYTDHTGSPNVQNEVINNLVEWINFMSEKIDNFNKQLQEIITVINIIKEENSIFKKGNTKLIN